MAMTYRTLTGTITRPGSDIGVRVRVVATPLTTNASLTYTDDNRITVGPETVETNGAGVLPTFKIPTNVDIGELYWRITAERLDNAPGVPKKWTLKNAVQITGSGNTALKDLVEIDTIAVDAQILVNLSDLVTDAEDARDDAESAALDAEDHKSAAEIAQAAAAASQSAAAGSASAASTSAGTASTQAGNAASSASAADASADAAATDRAAVEDLVGAAEAVAVTNDTIMASRASDPESAFSGALSASYGRGVSVTDPRFGAVGDGTTDDTDAIEAAIAAISAGDSIFFPRGTYRVTSTIVLSKSMEWSGEPGAEIVAEANPFRVAANSVTFRGLAISADAQRYLFHPNVLADTYDSIRLENCRISKLLIEASAPGADNGDGTDLSASTNILNNFQLVGCEIFDQAYNQHGTVRLLGTANAIVERCWIHDVGVSITYGDAIKVSHGAHGTRLAFNTIENATRDGIDVYNSVENTIIGNNISDVGHTGIDLKWLSTTTPFTDGRDIVQGNRIRRATDQGINANTNNSLFIGNIVEETLSGGDAYRVNFSIDVSSPTPTRRVSLIGNIARGGSGDGFQIESADSIYLSGNTAVGNTGRGFRVVTSSNVILIGNTARDNTDFDITLDATSLGTATLVGNYSDDSTYHRATVTPNNTPFRFVTAAGIAQQWAKLNPSDQLIIGEGIAATRMYGTSMGFFGASPVTKRTLGAAATDAATTQTLANALRQALIDLGLGQT